MCCQYVVSVLSETFLVRVRAVRFIITMYGKEGLSDNSVGSGSERMNKKVQGRSYLKGDMYKLILNLNHSDGAFAL